MKAVITAKGQITIPVAIRERLSLHAGTVLEFDEQSHYLVARPVIDEKRMRSVIGCVRSAFKGERAKTWLNETRGPVELPRP